LRGGERRAKKKKTTPATKGEKSPLQKGKKLALKGDSFHRCLGRKKTARKKNREGEEGSTERLTVCRDAVEMGASVARGSRKGGCKGKTIEEKEGKKPINSVERGKRNGKKVSACRILWLGSREGLERKSLEKRVKHPRNMPRKVLGGKENEVTALWEGSEKKKLCTSVERRVSSGRKIKRKLEPTVIMKEKAKSISQS